MKRVKKLMAVMLLGVTLCGNVLTAHATCAAHEPQTKIEILSSSSVQHQHTDASGTYPCTVTTQNRRITVTCKLCGITLYTTSDVVTTHTRN